MFYYIGQNYILIKILYLFPSNFLLDIKMYFNLFKNILKYLILFFIYYIFIFIIIFHVIIKIYFSCFFEHGCIKYFKIYLNLINILFRYIF